MPETLFLNLSSIKRREVTALLAEWQTRPPWRSASIATSMTHVVPSHLMDRDRFDFAGLIGPVPGGIAFDEDPCA